MNRTLGLKWRLRRICGRIGSQETLFNFFTTSVCSQFSDRLYSHLKLAVHNQTDGFSFPFFYENIYASSALQPCWTALFCAAALLESLETSNAESTDVKIIITLFNHKISSWFFFAQYHTTLFWGRWYQSERSQRRRFRCKNFRRWYQSERKRFRRNQWWRRYQGRHIQRNQRGNLCLWSTEKVDPFLTFTQLVIFCHQLHFIRFLQTLQFGLETGDLPSQSTIFRL